MPDRHGRHRDVRPRYGRMSAAFSAVLVTSVAVLGGAGMLPSAAEPAPSRDAARPVAATPDPAPQPAPWAGTTARARDSGPAPEAPPAASGEGRRVVYSEGRQQVWIVGSGGRTRRTYPVSGSIYDNLDPGTYRVYSRSLHATGIQDSGTMQYFVRFARGDTGAAIGFHDIPVKDGQPLQGVDELGTPTSHGCIRQRRADARAMWAFARLGTTVVVTA